MLSNVSLRARRARAPLSLPRATRRLLAEALEPRRLLTALVIDGTSGNDTITVSANGTTIAVNFNGTTTSYSDATYNEIDIAPGDGADTVNINSNSDNLVNVNFTSTPPFITTNLDSGEAPGGNAGSDANLGISTDYLYVGGQTTASLTPITAPVFVSGSANSSILVVYLDDINGGVSRTYDINSTTVQWGAGNGQLGYTATATGLIIEGGSAGDQYNLGTITGAHGLVSIMGGSGNDSLTTSTNHLINATDDAAYNGGAGLNTLVLDNTGVTNAFLSYSVTSTTAGYASGPNSIKYSNVGIINFFPSAGGGVDVQGTNPGELVNIHLLNNSSVSVGDVGTSLNNFGGGGVSVFGAPAFDSVTVNDDATTDDHTFSMVNNALSRDGSLPPLCTVDSAVNQFTLSAGSGIEAFNFGSATATGPGSLDGDTAPLTFFTNSGTESANFNDQSSTFAGAYTIDASTFTRGAWSVFFNSGLQHLALRAASGTNTINVNAAPGATSDVPTITGGGGADTLNINSDGGSVAAAAFDQTETFGGLNVFNGGSAQLASTTTQILTTNALSIAVGGTVDVSKHQLNVGGTTPSTIRTLIQSAKLKTTAAGGVLGYASAGGSAVNVRFTIAGDATLDRAVGVGDLGALATNYGATTGQTWAQGDFDYNGTIDVADLGELATNYGQSLAGGLGEVALVEPALAERRLLPEPPAHSNMPTGNADDLTVSTDDPQVSDLIPGVYARLFNDAGKLIGDE